MNPVLPPESAAAINSETLFRRYASFVAGFLFRLGARDAELEDLVQEVFVTAHRKGGYLPGAASPTTYLARLALEMRLSKKRRDQRFRMSQSEQLAAHVVGPEAITPEHALQLQQSAAQMQRALDAMEPTTRAVFVLFELEGQDCDAIAAGLELKVGTVYSRLHAARKTFRQQVAKADPAKAHP